MNFLSGESSIYYKIQNQSLEIGERDVARIFDMARFDPRLMEVATEFVRDYWWNLNPVLLNKSLKNAKFPYAIKPATSAIVKNCEFSSQASYLKFITWYESAVTGIKNPPPQLFYIAINPIGSKSMRREEKEAISCFTDFNLIAKDIPFNKGRPGIVKSKEVMADHISSAKSLIKSELAKQIKDYKELNHLKNEAVSMDLGINRVFLSKILNNKLEKITVDYLMTKVAVLNQKFKNVAPVELG